MQKELVYVSNRPARAVHLATALALAAVLAFALLSTITLEFVDKDKR